MAKKNIVKLTASQKRQYIVALADWLGDKKNVGVSYTGTSITKTKALRHIKTFSEENILKDIINNNFSLVKKEMIKLRKKSLKK